MEDLKNVFKEVWENEIQKNYSKGNLCTEGGLQALFYHFLKSKSELDKYEIWVVPTLYFDTICEISSTRPDLLVSLNSEIICIVELKYNIEIGVSPFNDLNKLSVFLDQAEKNNLALRINPNTGKCIKDLKFSISENVLCVFAVIAHEASDALYQDRWKGINLPSNFLHLIGNVTGNGFSFKAL